MSFSVQHLFANWAEWRAPFGKVRFCGIPENTTDLCIFQTWLTLEGIEKKRCDILLVMGTSTVSSSHQVSAQLLT